MSGQWVQQEIIHRVGWSARVWQRRNTESFLKVDGCVLDEVLANTEVAFKHDQTTTVAKLDLVSEQGPVHLVLKRYNPRSLWHTFKRAFRRSRARRCWNMSYLFSRAGLNVAPPVLMLEQRFGPIRLNAYFVNEFLEGEELLSALPVMSVEQQSEVVVAVKSAFAKMQAARLTHGDMKASNLIWVAGELFFIDLDAAQRHSSMLSWRKSHQKDKKRFLKNWRDHPALLTLLAEL